MFRKYCFICKYCTTDGYQYFCELHEKELLFTFLLEWCCKGWEAKE